MQFNYRKAAIAAMAVAALSGPALAEDPKPLGPVVVTSSRQEIPLDEALAAVTVLTRGDIESSQAPDLLDLLARQPGIDIARSGGPGQASTVFMRGGNSTHTLVLVDGIRVNPATQGAIDFAHLPLAQIERIEIVRGPRAALWGSDAIGGVIHVFTRDPSSAFLEAHAGSYGRAGATVGAGFGNGELRAGVIAGAERLQGFSATNSSYPFGNYPDRDGYRNQNLGVRGSIALGGHRLGFSGLVTRADVEFDEGRTDAQNRVFGLSMAGAISARWSHSLVLGRSSEDLDTPVYESRFGSSRTSLDWTNTVQLDERNTLNAGFNWSREGGYSDEAFVGGFEKSRHNAAAFVSWRGRFERHLLELSLRRDRNSQFGGASTANLAWGWQPSKSLRLRASWGQGFRAPDFNELYYPGFFGLFAGNQLLQPERSTSSEAGMEWALAEGQRLGVSAYRTRIDQLIAFDGPMFQARNVNRAAVDGVEIDYAGAWSRYSVEANASWMDARDAETRQPLLRRADRKLFLSTAYRLGEAASLGMDVSLVSARPDFGGIRLPGYARLDLRWSAPLAPGWMLEARLENLTDRDYELVSGYNTPGRSGMLNVRWSAELDRARRR